MEDQKTTSTKPSDPSSNDVDSLDSTVTIGQLDEGDAQKINCTPTGSDNDGNQIDQSSAPSGIEEPSPSPSQPEESTAAKYVPPHLRSGRNIAATRNGNMMKNEHVQPTTRSLTMPRYDSSKSRSPTWRTIDKEIGPLYEGRNRKYHDGRGARKRTDFSVNRKSMTGQYNGNRLSCITLKYLDDLLKLNDESFVLKISENTRSLNDFVAEHNLSDDSYVLVIRILKKALDTRFPDSQRVLLMAFLKEQFINNLQKYLGSLPMHDKYKKTQNQYFWTEPDAFWTTLIDVSRRALEILPSYAANTLPKVVLALQIYIPIFEVHQKQHVSDEIKRKLEELVRILEETKLRFENVAVDSKTEEKSTIDYDEPPDDFRTISVYPDAVEILGARSFLRPNVVDGPYKDAEHYLDVQFRLLREDFVNPMRCGVRSILSGDNDRHENIKVYENVRFLYRETVDESHCVRLKFNFNETKLNSTFEGSKKLIFGTLLCFTCDNFATLKFARVVKRDKTDLERGELVVGFAQSQPDLRFNHEYLMIECTIYFEPYLHVLTALKSINGRELAMIRYIVDVRTDNNLPEYLKGVDEYEIDGRYIPIDSLQRTTDNFYGFNDSQLSALKGALTCEFTLIQGPPGTGKTFLGLKIAQVLLRNSRIWFKRTPMLVICFTNHALDQFLEGLLKITDNIVRIGGQSKNEILNEYNLTELRKQSHYYGPAASGYEIKETMSEILSVTDQIKRIDQYPGVLSLLLFNKKGYIDTELFRSMNIVYFSRTWLLENRQNQGFQKQSNESESDIDRSENLASCKESDDDAENCPLDDDHYNHFNQRRLAEKFFSEALMYDAMFDITLMHIDDEITELRNELHLRENDAEKTISVSRKYEHEEINDIVEFLLELERHYENLERRMNEVKCAIQNKNIRTDIDASNLESLSYDERWALYTFWLDRYRQYLEGKAYGLRVEYQALYRRHGEIRNWFDMYLLRDKLVVGMTTTGAARLRPVLEGLRCPIVIVEEAAEVLEAHIITALTQYCQHLILIGDHKQLRPNSADYTIANKFKLGISLFERMVINGVQCHSLNVQHRMRPEISRLICPIIYTDLENHESVFNRPLITGVDSCVRFVDHRHLEDDCGGSSTKKNSHEVKFAVALARHLLLNGYKSKQVTILAAYLGQMYEMIEERDKRGSIMQDIRIAALDNYQGEESDIIILSLVRSNTEGKIGFLAIENRVCVALSRAKLGLFIIGNMELLSSCSELWGRIKTTLEEQNAIGPDLTLRCGIHTDITTAVSSHEDFDRVPEGGCLQICKVELGCGHECQSVCHIQDREHDNYKCFARCEKNSCDKDVNHICQKMCFEECGSCTYRIPRKLDCGHEVSLECHIDLDTYECLELVSTKLPCDHVADKPCHMDVAKFNCPMPCEVTIDPCGHSCTRNCHYFNDPDHIEYRCMKKCARLTLGCTMVPDSDKHSCSKLCYEQCVPCDIPIQKQRTMCTHMELVACHIDVDSTECTKPCTKILDCGHKCKKQCSERCEVASCVVKVKKIVPACGHEVWAVCGQEPNRNRCTEACPLQLSCGHPCTKRCNQPCTSECEIMVDYQEKVACGHLVKKIMCHLSTSGFVKNDRRLLVNCTKPCDTKLKCGHQCGGTCGECLQGRFHKRCTEKCGVPLVCNHECSFPCREACRPCNQPCSYRCVHSICKKKCGEICIPCKEPCRRQCEHQKCSKFCSSICDVPACIEPCPKLLDCGHACIGFCGDPCPSKCLICDREELLEAEMLFGYEDENSRFVFLSDCKHVIESEGMQQWLEMGDNCSAIGLKVCPKCKTPIKTTLRYSDHIKNAIQDVNKVKMKAVGSADGNNGIRQDLTKRVKMLQCNLRSSIWESYLQKLETRMQPVRKQVRQNIDKVQLVAITAKVQVLEQLDEILTNENGITSCLRYQQDIHDVLARDVDYITDQEIEDVMMELPRLLRAIQYERIKQRSQFIQISSTDDETKLLIENIQTALDRMGPYSGDGEVKSWLEKLNKLVGVQLALSDVENREIVKAMEMGRGHWFKCPNGHVYAIGECGGAMEISKCNECGAEIGGTSHTLLASNSLASEMDGARYAAYSEMANNMGNFINLI